MLEAINLNNELFFTTLTVNIENKFCAKCEKIKDSKSFHKCKITIDGLQHQCIDCRKKHLNRIAQKQWYEDNKEIIATRNKNYQSANKEKINKQQLEYRKKDRCKWRNYNRDYQRAYNRTEKSKQIHKRYNDKHPKDKEYYSRITKMNLAKDIYAGKSNSDKFGNHEELRTYIDSLLLEGMTKDNFQILWTIGAEKELKTKENLFVKWKRIPCE